MNMGLEAPGTLLSASEDCYQGERTAHTCSLSNSPIYNFVFVVVMCYNSDTIKHNTIWYRSAAR